MRHDDPLATLDVLCSVCTRSTGSPRNLNPRASHAMRFTLPGLPRRCKAVLIRGRTAYSTWYEPGSRNQRYDLRANRRQPLRKLENSDSRLLTLEMNIFFICSRASPDVILVDMLVPSSRLQGELTTAGLEFERGRSNAVCLHREWQP